MSDIERMLEASILIERLKTEKRLDKAAILALRETLAQKDAEIARLRSMPFRRDMTQRISSELSDIAIISDERRNL